MDRGQYRLRISNWMSLGQHHYLQLLLGPYGFTKLKYQVFVENADDIAYVQQHCWHIEIFGYVIKWQFSALLAICAGNSPVAGEFPTQRPVTQGFDVFFDLRLDKRLIKQRWGWRFATPSHPLWRHHNVCRMNWSSVNAKKYIDCRFGVKAFFKLQIISILTQLNSTLQVLIRSDGSDWEDVLSLGHLCFPSPWWGHGLKIFPRYWPFIYRETTYALIHTETSDVFLWCYPE